MPTKARYLADLLNASGELDSTGAIEAIQDQISSLFGAGTHTGISFSYDDSSGTFSATVGAEFIQDTVGAMFSSNTETNITVGYEDGDGTIDLAVEQQLNNTTAPYYHKVVVTVSGGKFLLDGGSQQTAKLSPNVVYRFDQSDSSNGSHPLRFSTTSDGTHGGGSEMSSGYTIYNKVGTAGSSGAYVEVCFEMDAMNPHYYYCANHSGMGGNVHLGEIPSTDQLTEGSTNLYHTTERVQDVVGGMVSSNTESGIAVTYDDSDGTLDFNVNDPTISLTGDVTGSATMTDLGNTSISTTIAANSVALGTDTTGSYVQSITGTANEISVSGSGSESADVTLALPDDVTIGNDLTVTGDVGAANLTLSGNLTVQGSTTTVSSTTLEVADGSVKVAKDNAANATDFGLYGQYVEGSTTKYAGLLWDASESSKFRLFHGNQSEPTTTVNTSGTGHTKGKLIADLEGNADTASALLTARTIAIAGDVVGSASFDGSGNISINSTIQADSVALGTDTTGNYLLDISAGEGIDVSHTQGEGSTATISVEDATETNKGIATFDGTDFTVSSGDVTINAERVQDIVGAMFSGNTETGVGATYQDDDGTIDLVVSTTASTITDLTESVEDIVGAMVTSNTESGITVAYDDSDGTLDFTVGTLNQDTTGNAATATALQNARTIHGVSFDGTANIDLTEQIQDTVNGVLVAGTNMSLSYDDAANTLTISSSGKTQEEVEDIVGAMFSSNTETGITVTYQDSDGTLDLVIGNDAIVSSMIADNTIVGGNIAANTIGSSEIAANAVGASELADNAVDTDAIANNAVTLGTKTSGAYVSDINVDSGELTASESNDAGETNSVTLGLANSGVSAGTYGSASAIPALTIDAFGRITAASTNAVDTYSGWSQAADSGTTKSVVEGTTMTFAGGEGMNTSISDSTVTVAGEDATATNKGIASFNSNHFSVSSGAVSILEEFIEDTVGAMVTSNSESGITVTYDDSDGTLDFSTSVTQTPAITSDGSTPSLNSGISASEIRNLIGAGTSSFNGAYSSLSGLPTIPTNNNQLTNGAGYITSNGLSNLSNNGNNLSGSFTATGNITAYSDERLKDNILTIDNALDKVSQMRGVTFTKDDKLSSGIIAQELEKIAPELVHDGEYKSIAYGNVVGYLIEAIKELKERLDNGTS